MFLLDFANMVQDFLTVGLFEFAEDTIEYWTAKYLIFSVKAQLYLKIKMIGLSYGVAEQILSQLSFNDVIAQLWAQLPSSYLAFFASLKVPECINMITSAYLTRYVMGVLS